MTESRTQRRGIVVLKPPEIIPGRVIPFTEIPGMRLVDLRSGDQLGGIITREHLDTAADYLAMLLCRRMFRGLGLKSSSSPNMQTLFQYYRQDADGRNCIGDIRDFEAVIRSNEQGVLAFQAKGNVYSSGRIAAQIDRMNTLTITPRGNPALASVLLNEGDLDEKLGIVVEKSKRTALLVDYIDPFRFAYPSSKRP